MLIWNHRTYINSSKLFMIGILGVFAYNLYEWNHYRKKNLRKFHQSNFPSFDTWPDRPKVSVLVAAWNEAARIQQHIHSFLSLRYPNKELIVCAGGQDETYNIAHQNSSENVIVLLQSTGQGKQGALISCFSECNGEIIYLTDADCILDDKSFERMIYPIVSGEEIACSGGSQPFETLLRYPLIALQAATDFVQFTDLRTPQYYPGMFGRNCALSRQAVHTTGGFSNSAPTGTDYVLAMELDQNNIRIKQIQNSLIRSDYTRNPKEYILQKRRWHQNVLLFSFKYRNYREFAKSFVLSAVAIFMLLMPVLNFVIGQVVIIVWLLLLLNGYLSRKRYLHFFNKTIQAHDQVSTRYILLSLFLDFTSWSLAILDLFSPRLRPKWK